MDANDVKEGAKELFGFLLEVSSGAPEIGKIITIDETAEEDGFMMGEVPRMQDFCPIDKK